MFSLCKPISSKKRFSPFRKLDDAFSFTLFDSAARINKSDWDAGVKKIPVFLELEYLSILEKCRNTKMVPRYVVVYNNQKPCGIIYFQIVDFQAGIFGDLLSSPADTPRSARLKLFENYIGSNKEEVLMRMFTCGNNVVSGDYGYLFSKEVKEEKAHTLLLGIIDVVSKEEKLRGTISAVLLKDFEEKLQPENVFTEEKYTDFFVEPNLVVDIPEGVNSLVDYTALFSKKYRNRAKSIFKAGDKLQKKDLSIADIQHHEKEIYALYESVYDKAKFKLIKLPVDYFSAVKKWSPEIFFVTGFFLENKLVAFSSCFLMDEKILEAHYIGFDYDLNSDMELYQNILYANIESAIMHGRCVVNLGRTAAEIKTTVGAKAVNLICYVKPQNTISKLIMKPFIGFLQPSEWTPRNPFKEENLQDSPEKKKQSA